MCVKKKKKIIAYLYTFLKYNIFKKLFISKITTYVVEEVLDDSI